MTKPKRGLHTVVYDASISEAVQETQVSNTPPKNDVVNIKKNSVIKSEPKPINTIDDIIKKYLWTN